jgi:hypothetical protein
MALWALIEVLPAVYGELRQGLFNDSLDAVRRGAEWLLKTRDEELGWVPAPLGFNRARYPGLTAQVLFVLTLLQQGPQKMTLPLGYVRALDDFLMEASTSFPQWEFGSLAANLAINLGDVVLQGTNYRLESSELLWAPWSLALLGLLNRPGATRGNRRLEQLPKLLEQPAGATHRALSNARSVFASFQIGETLFGVSWLRGGMS